MLPTVGDKNPDLLNSKSLLYITGADFIVRSAYQMGKTPLLPIFASYLGAEAAFLGFIVSVSTLTGMVLKPLVGVLSDRWGRRSWLIVGTIFFVVMPFLYQFVSTPEQLFYIRIIHGFATAIYGPVTLAYVAEISITRRAERLGWFGFARNGGYIVGPAVAGWMLLVTTPASVFTVIGIVSIFAFLPIIFLPEKSRSNQRTTTPIIRQVITSIMSGSRTLTVWVAGALEGTMFISLYSVRTFLPLLALNAGFNIGIAGTFFAVQEAIHLIANPLGGRLGDKIGYRSIIPLGILFMSLSLPLITVGNNIVILFTAAAIIGVAQACVFPSTLTLVSNSMGKDSIGTGLGLLGTLKNAGKVVGPTISGAMIHWIGYNLTFQIMALTLILVAILIIKPPDFLKSHFKSQALP